MSESRIGRFKISQAIVRKDPDSVAAVFSKMRCVPVRIDVRFLDDAMEYTAISPEFDAIATADEIPWYRVSSCGDGSVKVEREA